MQILPRQQVFFLDELLRHLPLMPLIPTFCTCFICCIPVCIFIYLRTPLVNQFFFLLLPCLLCLVLEDRRDQGSSLGMINDHESCLSNMTIYAVQVLCNKLHERKQWIPAFQFLTSISQPTLQPTLQLAFQHLKTTAQCYH